MPGRGEYALSVWVGEAVERRTNLPTSSWPARVLRCIASYFLSFPFFLSEHCSFHHAATEPLDNAHVIPGLLCLIQKIRLTENF